jgi:hypothetical protein
VGIIADDMAEVVERTKNTMEGAATSLRHARVVELVLSDPDVVQLNVDGIMLVHITNVDNVVPTPFRAGRGLPPEFPPVLVDNRKVP